MNKILIVEDDRALACGLSETLQAEHYRVVTAATGASGLSAAEEGNMDLIILDLMLPDRNGIQVSADLRRKGVGAPILMLTSRTDEIDKVVGLESGADDYVTKPFSMRELLARINALLRRHANDGSDLSGVRWDGVLIDFRKMEAFRQSEPVHLTATEFALLKYLASRRGAVVSRDELLNNVWGYDHFPTTRTIDTCILSLRRKLEDDGAPPRHILTVHGVGYRFIESGT